MPFTLDPEVEEWVDQIVAQLRPLTDEELDAVADVIARIRLRGDQDQDR